MLRFVPYVTDGLYDSAYRTEDVRFSPSGQRLAIAATEDRVLVYAIDAKARPVRVSKEFELRSSALKMPHGIDFLGEDVLVVANRNADLQFYRLNAAQPRDGVLEIEPEHRVHSPWFGPLGVRRHLREREIVCGPGQVRAADGTLFVNCNYRSTLSAHTFTVSSEGIEVSAESILVEDGIEIPDGIALSSDGRWLALSDHDHHRLIVFARTASGLVERCSLRDEALCYPHGLCFDRPGRKLFCVDAGSPYVYAFASGDEWTSDLAAAAARELAVDEETIAKTRSHVPLWAHPLEGGAKGIDLDPSGRTLAVTCENQPLAFFEIAG